MTDYGVLDEIETEVNPGLCSKFSILILGFTFSPTIASYLYCTNLRRTNQQKKITSFFITIVFLEFFSFVPFLGFNFNWNGLLILLLIKNFLVTLLMIFPFWNTHFSDSTKETFFPSLRFSLLVSFYFSLLAFDYLTETSYSYNNPPWYIPNFSTFSITLMVVPIVFSRFLLLILKSIKLLYIQFIVKLNSP